MIRLILIRTSLLSLLTAVSLGGLFLFPQTNSQAAAAPSVVLTTGITRQETSADSLSFTLVTPADPAAQANLETSGLNAMTHEPGAPELPYFTTLIALPPEAEIQVSVTARGETAVANTYVPPAAQPTLANIDPANAVFLPETAVLSQSAGERIPDAAIYQNDSRYPPALYQVSQPMYYRDMRLVRLELFPIQYNPLKQERYHAAQLEVDITFSGASLDKLHPAPSANDAYQQTAASLILNFEQARNWRSLPQSEEGLVETAVPLPTDRTSYKIELNQNGIYEITGADLLAAGMNITNTNPSTLQMMSRGESVAYQLIDNGDNKLDPTDIIRFYGEAVHATRREKQFLRANVYWLWANGSPTTITSAANETGGETATNFLESITREDENGFSSTYTNQWHTFPNEPDSWNWQLLVRNGTQPLKRLPDEAPTLNLPDPELNSGTTVTYTVEINPISTGSVWYKATTCLNSYPSCGEQTWFGIKNLNITHTAPITALVNGVNTVNVDLSNPPGYNNNLRTYVNRITIDYLRALKAYDDQLIFPDVVGGRAMVVQGFTETNEANILAWDITNARQPVALTGVTLNSASITLGRTSPTPKQYIATTLNNVLSGSEAITLSAYTPPASLEPAQGADWIAITHADFLAQATTLANHRANLQFGGLKTYVVDIEDVVNLYGYGLHMPEAINTYLKNALYNWDTPPGYVVLFGDATISPRNLDCSDDLQPNGLRFCPERYTWDKDAQNFVPTDMMFIDRFQGLIPSDQTAVLLAGDDILPDMAIGRLPANDAAQANNMVDKIMQYEQNQFNTQANGAWQKNVLFLADKADALHNFCEANQNDTGSLLPASFPQQHICLDNFTAGILTPEEQFRQAMSEALVHGASLVNYRGHGAIQYWGGNPRILNADSTVTDDQLKQIIWQNNYKPVVLISADCLDGHFAHPGQHALSERFLRLGDVAGTAANWSSSGLGYDNEHTALLHGFYTGVFNEGHTAIGDAVNHAKLYYYNTNYWEDEIYSFNLQGDPAMQLYRPEVSLSLAANQSNVIVYNDVAFTLTATNQGFYPDHAAITVALPTGLAYVETSSTAAHTVTVDGNQVVIELSNAIMQGETAVITLHTTANGQAAGPVTTTANLTTAGLDLNPNNQSGSVDVTIHFYSVYLPMIKK